MSSTAPLKSVASAILAQDEASHKRQSNKIWLDANWIKILATMCGLSVAFVLLWPMAVILISEILHEQWWFDTFIPKSVRSMTSSLASGSIVVPMTLPAIIVATFIAARQSYLNKLCQIADDKRKIRSQTIDHLRMVINKYRKDEQEFMADLIDIYFYLKIPSRVKEFTDAVLYRFACVNSREYDDCLDEHVLLMRDLLWDLGGVRPMSGEHSRPIVNPQIVDLARDYYPLFSYIWGHLMHHEALGMGLARKSFGIRTLDGISGPQIVDTFRTWQEFILAVRGIHGYRTSFQQLQWLASCIVMLRASRSAAKYYNISVATSGDPDLHNYHWLELAANQNFLPFENKAYYRPRSSSALSPIYEYIIPASRQEELHQALLVEIRTIQNSIASRSEYYSYRKPRRPRVTRRADVYIGPGDGAVFEVKHHPQPNPAQKTHSNPTHTLTQSPSLP